MAEITSSSTPLLGFFIGMTAAGFSALALLALPGIWVPTGWRRPLAVAGALVELLLMALFFGPTKLVPIAVKLIVIGAVAFGWPALRVA